MNLIVALEARFNQDSKQQVWTDSTFGYSFWTRYLDVFDEVIVLVRVTPTTGDVLRQHRVDGLGVRVLPLPHYLGPVDYLRNRRLVRNAIAEALRTPLTAVIVRAPGQVASDVVSQLEQDRPYGVEVVGDPFEVFAPGAIRHPARPYLRWRLTRELMRIVGEAAAVSYVTDRTLQMRYPAGPDAFTTSYSSIDLPADGVVDSPRSYQQELSTIRLITVGSLEQLYKAPDVLIRAVTRVRDQGHLVHLTILGGGRHRPELELLAQELGLTEEVTFLGHLPAGVAVQDQLDKADIFVLPSRTEGLPRAMIEAMSRGVPAVGSAVGGIPELLDAADLVPPGDVDALAAKLMAVMSDPDRMHQMSVRNLTKAREYQHGVLQGRRESFYTSVRSSTDLWMNSRGKY